MSPEFDIGGVTWQLLAYLNGGRPEARGHVSVFLRAVPAAGQAAARSAHYTLSVEGPSESVSNDANDWFNIFGQGFFKLCSHAGEQPSTAHAPQLQPPTSSPTPTQPPARPRPPDLEAKRLMESGLIKIKVDISKLEVYDM